MAAFRGPLSFALLFAMLAGSACGLVGGEEATAVRTPASVATTTPSADATDSAINPADELPLSEDLNQPAPTTTRPPPSKDYPIEMVAPEAGLTKEPVVIDPGGDVCLALLQASVAGAATFGSVASDSTTRSAAPLFTQALTYLLETVPSIGAETSSGFQFVAARAGQGAPDPELWELLLDLYERKGQEIDSAVLPLLDDCPDMEWYPEDNSVTVVTNLRRLLGR